MPRCPEFIWNTLEVSGPKDAVAAFMSAAAGSGFLDHWPDWYNLYEYTYFLLMRGGAPSKAAAEALAQKIRDRAWRAYEWERSAADRDPTGCPFDLNALFPVPHAVLERGGEAVADWMWANWGTRSAPWRVSLETALRRAGEGVRLIYAFTFLTEDWSPWIAVKKLRARWPTLLFELRTDYLVPSPASAARPPKARPPAPNQKPARRQTKARPSRRRLPNAILPQSATPASL